MTISAVNRASVFNGANAASYATGSYTPGLNKLMICWVENEFLGVPNTPTVTGNGLTWNQIVSYLCDTSGTQIRITAFAALSGASPSAGAVTADFAAQVQAGGNVIVDEFTGADVLGTALAAIVQSKIGTVDGSGLSESITLNSAITAGNATAGAFEHQVSENSSNGSGYTILGNGNHAGPASALISEYRPDGNVLVDSSWATSGGKGGIALEIKSAPATPIVQGSGYADFFFGERERAEDTSPRFNPTLRERQMREEEEILIL